MSQKTWDELTTLVAKTVKSILTHKGLCTVMDNVSLNKFILCVFKSINYGYTYGISKKSHSGPKGLST